MERAGGWPGRGIAATPLGIVAIYFALGTAWILLSDTLVDAWLGRFVSVRVLQTGKGIFYIGFTSLLLYLLIRRYAAELYRHERRYFQFFNHARDMTFICDGGGRLLNVNLAAEALTGHGYDALRRMRLEALVAPEDYPAVAEALRFETPPPPEASRAPRPESAPRALEARLLRKDGTARRVELTFVPHWDGGALAYVLGTAHDITEASAAEEALRESERTLRTLLANLPGMAYRCANAPDWPVTFASEGAEALTGKPARYWIGRAPGFGEIIDERDREYVRESIASAVREGRPFQLTYRIQPGPGETKWVWEQGRGVFEADGQMTALEGIVMDITNQRQARLALERSESALRLMFDNNPLPMWVYDCETLRFLEVNAAAAARYGHAREDFLAMTLGDIVEDFVAEAEAREQSQARHRTRDGRVITVETFSRPLTHEERPARLEVLHDLTERIAAEAEIRELNRNLETRVAERTAELESANRELAAFGYSVSHDLRAPLRAIKGFGEIIAGRHRASLPEEARRYFDNIVEASGHMERLIDDLLAYARLGRSALTIAPVDLGKLCGEVVAALRDRIQAAEATVHLPEEWPALRTDRTRLSQILLNLLSNAVKYQRPDAPPEIYIAATREGDGILLTVTDNGIGIAPAYHEKIFEVFQRLHAQEDIRGTGIGLAIVKRSVELLRGRVWVSSAPGEGARFYVWLPENLTD